MDQGTAADTTERRIVFYRAGLASTTMGVSAVDLTAARSYIDALMFDDGGR